MNGKDCDKWFCNTGIGFFKWKDSKVVTIASNYRGSEMTSIMRKNKDGTKSSVTCTSAVADYNAVMAGDDLADRLRTI